MTKLSLIPGLTPSTEQLLESCGIASAEDLARQGSAALCQRLTDLEARRRIEGPVPGAEELVRWIQAARNLVEGGASAPAPAVETTPRSLADGVTAPAVNLNQVPEAVLVRRPAAAVAARDGAVAAPRTVQEVVAAAPVAIRPLASPGPGGAGRFESGVEAPRKAAPRQQFRDFKAYEAGATGVEPLARKPAEDEEEVEASLRRAKYKAGEPIPRMVRRGVPHPRPFFLVFCSLIVLVWRLLMLAVVVGTPVVVWPAFAEGDTTHLWWFLWVIGAWLISCVFYLFFALRARCRVCTNQIFWSKRCFKNSKAHRIPGLGLVGSLALHALLFGWFRCMYCGTAIRLKFVADPERSK